ncbi:uncharacterized protein BHQ10_005147 [Talaromyces amestolkiae]|uniref:Myosin-binding domain-containing protein n=1 Tax=Talaromyces amestolkiae TaxID=1196081 RepID=A0A364L015_TALAM|nr:uncharacterized protein BHQ10_005147 [Talaromyces amestolkiae]RAO69135.1 hypothetical protein BHQ10_005147 [Talaromyces amestolkiae]
MESLVYEDSPLADYLEGEGERDQDWAPLQIETNGDAHSQNFAPKGLPTVQTRVRDASVAASDRNSSQEQGTGVFGRIHHTCSSAVSSRIGKRDNERFLEQFGYVIVASHLLDEYNAASHTTAAKDAQPNLPGHDAISFSTTVGLTGAVVTAVTSFSIVGLIHWSRSRTSAGFNPRRLVILLVVLPLVGAVFYAFARRQWLRSTPLPPVSRLEETTHVRRCLRLRRAVSEGLSLVLDRYIQAQHTIGLLTDSSHLEKYYDIYEISMAELAEARSTSSETIGEDQYSLKWLRIMFSRLYTMRQSILCCLLALKADGSGSDIPPWTCAVEEMRELATVTHEAANKIANILNEKDKPVPPLSPIPSASTGRDTLRAQARRLNSLSQGIRALHAKMHLMREESDESLTQDASEQDVGASLMAQYESIGADIRGLLQEWEAGKMALISSLEHPNGLPSSSSYDRFSRSSSNDLKLPLSPTSSLGGVTAVDGSPTAALMALNGEIAENVADAEAEEIFEAIVMPSSRKRQSLTREERIARVKEDRARQVAARERADASTNMLRELETVIKHRPTLKNKPQRITSI